MSIPANIHFLRLSLEFHLSNKQNIISKLHVRWSLNIVRCSNGIVYPRGMHRYGNSGIDRCKATSVELVVRIMMNAIFSLVGKQWPWQV